ncbi:MAG: hypothetical protein ACPHCJ_13210, partial [Oceanococcaceae bacterium]
EAAGLLLALSRRTVCLADLSSTPQGDALPLVPLMLHSGEDKLLRPSLEHPLQRGDTLLLACSERAAHRLQWLAQHSPHWGSPGLPRPLLDDPPTPSKAA